MDKQPQLLITNIQRMCFHDGPGIRTTVFLKGCNLHCPWCSNPENLNGFVEHYEDNGTKGIYGRFYEPSKLVNILLKDKIYWNNHGGVTFSGGEALTQIFALIEIMKMLKEYSVHIAVETALFVSSSMLQQVLPFIDYFIVDVKILDTILCKRIIGGDLELYKKNIDLLFETGKLKLFRFPCCLEYTFTDENKKQIEEFLKHYSGVPVEIFSVHHLGEKKYASLKRNMWKTRGVEKKELNDYCIQLNKDGIQAKILELS